MEQDKSTSAALRRLLKGPQFLIMPCCYDGLTAKIIQEAGFSLTFMSGFAASAARLGLPDTGLISYGEMADQLRDICSIAHIPVLADGDTLLSASLYAMKKALSALRKGEPFSDLLDFKDLQTLLGFSEYDETLSRLEGSLKRR